MQMQSFAHKMKEAPRELRGAPPAAEPVQFAATASNQDAKARLIILERGRADRSYWSDLWAYRELFVILAWRDLAVRYKQTALGLVWAVIRPILTVIVLTIVFGRLARLPGDGRAPYVLIVYAGT